MSIGFVSVRRKDKYIYRAFDFLPANCFETLILATDLKKNLKYSLRILIPFEEMRPEIPTFKMVGKQKNSRSV